MYYTKKIDPQYLIRLKEQEHYLEVTNLVINSMSYNLKRVEKKHGINAKLTELYNSVSFLGEDNGLSKGTERRIMELALHLEAKFVKIMHDIK